MVQNGRSTSRVLQPPGGSSSLCLGGYGSASDSNTKGTQQRSTNSNSYSNQPPRQSSNKSGSGYSEQRRDSLDEMVGSQCNIPGLQSHYQSDGGRRSDSRELRREEALYAAASTSRGGGMQGGALSGQDYAAQLRAQIDLKKSMKSDDDGYTSSSRSGGLSRENSHKGSSDAPNSRGSYGSRKYDDDDNGNGNGFPPKRSTHATAAGADFNSSRGKAPPGGASTFSIGWN